MIAPHHLAKMEQLALMDTWSIRVNVPKNLRETTANSVSACVILFCPSNLLIELSQRKDVLKF